MSSEQPL
ncbi:hypothetical protein R3I94_002748 [Phoxinus phoxinus]